jgi:hypothetical protein
MYNWRRKINKKNRESCGIYETVLKEIIITLLNFTKEKNE